MSGGYAMDNVNMPQIGEKAPEFQAQSTRGPIRFPGDFKGKWVVLFSFPGSFHPVCASELQALAGMQGQFAEHNCALLAFSPDSGESHHAWIREMEKSAPNGAGTLAGIPLVADDGGVISRQYGVLARGASRPVRGVFFIDPQAIVRAALFYPRGIGRNTAELFRILLALQAFQADGHLIPANWQPEGISAVPLQAASQNPQPTKTTENADLQEAAEEQPGRNPADTFAQFPYNTAAAPLLSKPADEQAQPSRQQPLRPVSQSVWDALAEAQPQIHVQPPQPSVAPPASPDIAAPVQVYKPIETKSAAKQPAAKGHSPVHVAKHSNVHTEGASIAEQNRLLLGGLLDKEDAESGKAPEGHEYLIMRDFPFNKS